MELVYLWVEDYKNIKKQGFNFSPRFKCEYDENTKELTINENKKYVSIFPDNINITAIVGENGSGKSNLLELISDLGYYENPYLKKEYPVLFSELSQIIVYYDKLKDRLYICKKNLITTINNQSSIIEKEITLESTQRIFIKPTPSHSQQEYLLLLDFLRNNNHIVFPFELPEIISFSIHDDCFDLLELIKTESFDFDTNYNPFEKNQNNRLKIFHILLILAYLKNYKIDFDIQASQNYDDTILELEKKIGDEIKLKIRSFIEMPLEDYSVITTQYVNIKKIPNDFFKTYIEIIKRKNNNDFLPFKGKNVFNFDFYPKMSDGQYQLTYIFNTISSQINQDAIILCIDEGENYLHPNWQKKYINYLYQFLKNNFSNKKIHFIVSSHSPFLVSDLPKENIIFLENGKQVYPFKDCEQTFGANIHTLLSHGFFMSGGLMGEFAKSKIEEIKKFYELVKKAEKIINQSEKVKTIIKNIYQGYAPNFRHIQSIIGEPFLNTIMKNYLDELDILFYGKNQFLDNEIQRLQALKDS